MQKTTAKVEHRDYVPYGWIAIEFCEVEFFGPRAKEMNAKWNAITHARYEEYESICSQKQERIDEATKEIEDIQKDIKSSKPFYRFWYNSDEKIMLAKVKALKAEISVLEEKIEEVKDKRFYGVYEKHRKLERLLDENGFTLTSTSSRGDRCITKVEIWTLEE